MLSLNALAGIHLLLTLSVSFWPTRLEGLNALAGIHLLLTFDRYCYLCEANQSLNALAGIHLLLT